MNIFSKIFKGDRVVWMVFLALCFISIVEVYSASSSLAFANAHYWMPIVKHTGYLLGGLLALLIVANLNQKVLGYLWLFLPIVWFLLILVKLKGADVNGAQRSIWGIQPSEWSKICLICTAAFLIDLYHKSKNIKFFYYLIAAAGITCVIIMIDNFSTAFFLFLVIYLMAIIGQVDWKKCLKTASIIGLVVGLFVGSWWVIPESVWQKTIPRALTWKSRLSDHSDDKDHYQVEMAKVAIARGGVIGVFPGNSRMRDFLPQAYSDFIFAIILEETGIVGGAFVMMLYIILLIRAGVIASRCKLLFPKMLAIGSALLITVQALINMAVAVSLFPVTGQPLPLISRGGNSIAVTCVLIGIILSVSMFNNPKGIAEEKQISSEFELEKNETNNESAT